MQPHVGQTGGGTRWGWKDQSCTRQVWQGPHKLRCALCSPQQIIASTSSCASPSRNTLWQPGNLGENKSQLQLQLKVKTLFKPHPFSQGSGLPLASRPAAHKSILEIWNYTPRRKVVCLGKITPGMIDRGRHSTLMQELLVSTKKIEIKKIKKIKTFQN